MPLPGLMGELWLVTFGDVSPRALLRSGPLGRTRASLVGGVDPVGEFGEEWVRAFGG